VDVAGEASILPSTSSGDPPGGSAECSPVRRRSTYLVTAVLVTTAMSGCGGGGGKGGGASSGTTSTAADKGDFKLVFAPPADDADKTAQDLLKSSGLIGGLVTAMNQSVALPADIAVKVQPGDDGPAYDPSTRTIVVGYPFVTYVAGVFEKDDPKISGQDLASKTNDVVAFVVLHEMGHALVDQLHIPITGKEEDSVDNLATVLTGQFVDDNGEIALNFADFFALLQKNPAELKAEDFWDTHSLDIQRANQAACLVYGSDPKKHANLAPKIDASRRESCADDWKQAADSWVSLLGPYLKE
jgi:hypothetical protein